MMITWNWYRRGDARDVVRRRGGVDLERVRAGRDPRAHARREGLAPGEAAHGRAAIGVVAHRLLLGCYRRNKTKKERRRDDATGPDNTHGAGGGGWFEERFALRRTNCCFRAAHTQLSVPAARFRAPLRGAVLRAFRAAIRASEPLNLAAERTYYGPEMRNLCALAQN